MNKKSWAFQVDTFGNSNLSRLSKINNQCHENHTTITLLALKLLVRSTTAPRSTSWGFRSQEEEGDYCCNSRRMGSHRIPSTINHLDITSFTKPRGQRRKDNKRPMRIRRLLLQQQEDGESQNTFSCQSPRHHLLYKTKRTKKKRQ
jgi:hypothetical protein